MSAQCTETAAVCRAASRYLRPLPCMCHKLNQNLASRKIHTGVGRSCLIHPYLVSGFSYTIVAGQVCACMCSHFIPVCGQSESAHAYVHTGCVQIFLSQKNARRMS